MQVNDVRGQEFRENGNVRTGIGNVDGKEVVLLEAVLLPDKNTLPNKLPYLPPVLVQAYHTQSVGLFFTN